MGQTPSKQPSVDPVSSDAANIVADLLVEFEVNQRVEQDHMAASALEPALEPGLSHGPPRTLATDHCSHVTWAVGRRDQPLHAHQLWRHAAAHGAVGCCTLESLPVWSRGIAKGCCDLGPTRYWCLTPQKCVATTDTDYSRLGSILKPVSSHSSLLHAVVYVFPNQMREFYRHFVHLPPNARLTLVSNGEDASLPREVFADPMAGFARMEYKGRSGMPTRNLTGFLADRRLLHWFVQNYDLRGSNPFSGPSRWEWDQEDSARLGAKVSAIPIGVDLHTLDEYESPCAQAAELRAVRAVHPSFAKKLQATAGQVLLPLNCIPNKMPGYRTGSCASLRAAAHTNPNLHFFTGPRNATWRETSKYALVAAPIGHGIDTQRLWETLVLGSVPVVLNSSLNGLYDPFPVAIVGSWDALSDPTEPARLAENIMERFGPEPFQSVDLRHRLSMGYWLTHIRRVHASAIAKELESLELERPA